MAGHVFISYSHQDRERYVKRLADFLRSENIPVWYDDKIVSGDRWERLIRDQIDACAAMIVVMTPDADNSDWVSREIHRARSRARPILPLLRSGEPFFGLSTVHYEDVRDGSMPGSSFVQRLRGLVPPEADTPPPPPEPPVEHPPVPAARRASAWRPSRRPSGWRPSGWRAALAALLAAVVVAGILVAISRPWRAGWPTTSGSAHQQTTALPGPSLTCTSGRLNAEGSSAQKSAMERWIDDYQRRCPGATVTYTTSGSGAGTLSFIKGIADFAGSEALLDDAQQTQANTRCGNARAIHLPMMINLFVVVYNVPGVSRLRLRPATLAKIFSGTVSTWDAPAIMADNAGVSLPATPIRTVHRSDSSPATRYFAGFLAATAPTDWPYGSDNAWKAPGGRGENGADGVVSAVAQTTGAIGYVERSFALANGSSMAELANAAGEFVAPSSQAAGRMILRAKNTGTDPDLRLALDYTTTNTGAYPLVSVTYEILCAPSHSGAVNLLASFLGYAASPEEQNAIESLGYAPLPDSLRSTVVAALVPSS